MQNKSSCKGSLGVKGFTLIELLVVVLIIGILAAVALPQYKVAVEKARATEAITILKSIKEAEERYYLANGSYTAKFEELDIDIPGTVHADDNINLSSGWKIYINAVNYVHATNKTKTNTLLFFHEYTSDSGRGKRFCYAKQNDTLANQVCKSLGGLSPYNAPNCAIGACTIYTL